MGKNGKLRQDFDLMCKPTGEGVIDLAAELERLISKAPINADNDASFAGLENGGAVEGVFKNRKPLPCSNCGRQISQGKQPAQPYRQGDRTLCPSCGRHELMPWANANMVVSKQYCCECSRLFRSVRKGAGRPHEYCSTRCSNTARRRTARARDV